MRRPHLFVASSSYYYYALVRYGIQPGFATAFARCVVLRAFLGKMLLACAAACAGRWAITGVFDVACGLSRYTRQPPCRRAVRNKH